MGTHISIPGFGWTSPKPQSVTVYDICQFTRVVERNSKNDADEDNEDDGCLLTQEEQQEIVTRTNVLYKTHMKDKKKKKQSEESEENEENEKLIDIHIFTCFIDELRLNTRPHEYREVSTSGTSGGGLALKWTLMIIAPNTRFRLHSHPNIEA